MDLNLVARKDLVVVPVGVVKPLVAAHNDEKVRDWTFCNAVGRCQHNIGRDDGTTAPIVGEAIVRQKLDCEQTIITEKNTLPESRGPRETKLRKGIENDRKKGSTRCCCRNYFQRYVCVHVRGNNNPLTTHRDMDDHWDLPSFLRR